MPGAKPTFPVPKLTSHPVDVGLRTEAAILSHLVRRGYGILLPFGVNQRYDLVLDLDGEFVRAQCKTGRLLKGTITFNTQSVQSNTRSTKVRGYLGEADFFLVFCRELDRVYAVPVAEASLSHMRLRVAPARNGQSQRLHWASDYELPG